MTDNAIGVAGVTTLLDYRGQKDAAGRTLEQSVAAVADEIASGLISHEMKYNIKKEFDDQVKYYKGLMN